MGAFHSRSVLSPGSQQMEVLLQMGPVISPPADLMGHINETRERRFLQRTWSHPCRVLKVKTVPLIPSGHKPATYALHKAEVWCAVLGANIASTVLHFAQIQTSKYCSRSASCTICITTVHSEGDQGMNSCEQTVMNQEWVQLAHKTHLCKGSASYNCQLIFGQESGVMKDLGLCTGPILGSAISSKSKGGKISYPEEPKTQIHFVFPGLSWSQIFSSRTAKPPGPQSGYQ